MAGLKVLMFGYNGANNTGAEALLLADIADVRAVLGPDAVITIPTLNPANLRRYVQEGPNLCIAGSLGQTRLTIQLGRLCRSHRVAFCGMSHGAQACALAMSVSEHAPFS